MQAEPSTSDLADKARFASSIARQAGALALERFRTPVTIETKEDASPVTEADRAAESLLRREIARQYPEHGILGEEYGTSGSPEGSLWVVDPIDGTRSFITGWPIWGTLLALTVAGRARVGLVHLPALDETWTGIAGGGSWFTSRDGRRQPCRTSDCTDIAGARFYTTSPDYFDSVERPAYRAIAQAVDMPRFGGDCYSYALLAAGHVDLVLETRLQPYDFLPLVPVVEEAGGVITDWQGRPLTLASGEQAIAAATPELHKQALALIAVSGTGTRDRSDVAG